MSGWYTQSVGRRWTRSLSVDLHGHRMDLSVGGRRIVLAGLLAVGDGDDDLLAIGQREDLIYGGSALRLRWR